MTDLTTERLDALEALAKAATPGPWYDDEGEVVCDAKDWPLVSRIDADGTVCTEGTAADIAYIAAANPATMLALIARLREAKKERRLKRWQLKESSEDVVAFLQGQDRISAEMWKELGDAIGPLRERAEKAEGLVREMREALSDELAALNLDYVPDEHIALALGNYRGSDGTNQMRLQKAVKLRALLARVPKEAEA
jgi:hypothetical protein